jgi:hypothetical protein
LQPASAVAAGEEEAVARETSSSVARPVALRSAASRDATFELLLIRSTIEGAPSAVDDVAKKVRELGLTPLKSEAPGIACL